MHGVGHNFRHSNKLGKQPRQGVEHRLQENKEIKAQYESKLGELTQENKGLQTELKSLQLERKEFEDAFIQLREQFDEMQTFNGKLALVNKLLMNGGLSFDQKLNVCEQFDGADTIEEAEKIYKSIIKENNIKVGDASNKIKASTTHTAKVNTESKPLYESEEARRMKQLAGMSKRLED
jgi:chromosome segregation ATPase